MDSNPDTSQTVYIYTQPVYVWLPAEQYSHFEPTLESEWKNVIPCPDCKSTEHVSHHGWRHRRFVDQHDVAYILTKRYC